MGKGPKSKTKTSETVFAPSVPAVEPYVNVFEGLEDREIDFLSTVTLDYAADVSSGNSQTSSGGKDRHNKAGRGDCWSGKSKGSAASDCGRGSAVHRAFVCRAESILEEHNMVIVKNALSATEVATLLQEYASLHSREGTQQAIGEKDASKRSGTRMYNCECQQGPKCVFKDWKHGTSGSRAVLSPDSCAQFSGTPPSCTAASSSARARTSASAGVWVDICRKFHLEHVARVEVVTSHVGCRAQDWHIDGAHGLTVIFPLAHVGIRQGGAL
jgi:hypothetical protein